MKKYKLILIIPLILMLIACFDQVEIEDRDFTVSLGIDKPESDDSRLLMSVSLPNMKAILENGDELKSVKEAGSDTLALAMSKLNEQSSKTLYFSQCKILVFGKSFLGDAELFLETLDSLERSKDIPKSIIVLAADGTAKETLEEKVSGSPMLGFYISNYYKNSPYASIESARLDLRTLINDIRENSSALIPMIEAKDGSVKLSGCSVMKDSRYAGSLSGAEMNGITWINGHAAGNDIDAPYDNGFIPLHVTKQNSRLSFSETDGRLTCDIFITAEGNILSMPKQGNELSSLQSLFEEKIEGDILLSFEKLQKEFKADALRLYSRLYKQNYALFQKLSSDWENVYESMSIVPHVTVTIKGTGGKV